MGKTKMTFTEALADLGDQMTSVIASVEGHRARLEAAGFSPTAAEQGALDYHRYLLHVLTGAGRG